MNTQPLLLIVDDEPAILQMLKESLEDEQYRVKTLSDGNKALEAIGNLVPDLVLLDVFMPNCNGLDILARITKEYPQQKVIIISGFGSIPIALTAMKRGAIDFIEKPLNLDDVLSKISLTRKTSGRMPEEQVTSTTIDGLAQLGIIGESSLFLECVHHVQHLAHLRHPLLIYGQHGTGKSLMAWYAHHVARKDTCSFITIDCSSKLDSFFDKLCGSINGTLFFKNINDLSVERQKELLRFLNSAAYKERNARGLVKIIASSYQSLFKLSLDHAFDHSLLHKLNLTPIELIPLNKRRYDIPLLSDYFLNLSNAKHKKRVTFSTKAIRFLRNHNWVGNITELKVFIETLVACTKDIDLCVDTTDMCRLSHEKNTHFIEEQSFLHFNSLQEAAETFERHFLTYTMKKSHFNMETVSDKLKISLDDLQNKISKHNICFK